MPFIYTTARADNFRVDKQDAIQAVEGAARDAAQKTPTVVAGTTAAGAVAGSVIPGVGTAFGAGVGSVVGRISVSIFGGGDRISPSTPIEMALSKALPGARRKEHWVMLTQPADPAKLLEYVRTLANRTAKRARHSDTRTDINRIANNVFLSETSKGKRNLLEFDAEKPPRDKQTGQPPAALASPSDAYMEYARQYAADRNSQRQLAYAYQKRAAEKEKGSASNVATYVSIAAGLATIFLFIRN